MTKQQLICWATAGDEDCMFKLATLYRDEGDTTSADSWLEKSAAAENFCAMKELAARLRENGDVDASVALYKKIVTRAGDVEAMEALVDMCAHDRATLQFVLDAINSRYNEIYLRGYSILWRTMELGTRRHNECTIQTLEAVERRRIASRIRKLLA